VKQLYQSNKEPVLGGKIEEISILFTDICNFTSIAEKIPVNDLAQALGKYLKVMTQAIQNNGQGIIDKYIGDGIMALWNTPTAVPNHAELACRAVLDCTKKLEELFASTQWQHLPRFDTRFGLHKDQVMVGHFGAPDRLNFTALGNGVNIASRLQELNKQYGTSILVSKTIVEATQKNFDFRLIDFIVLKGKTDGIKIYELMGEKGEKPQLDQIISKYEEAFDVYQKRQFANAMDLLKDQLHDGPSNVLYNRCAFFLQNPPPDSWNGIYIFTIKG
jgi:adenylate cyclase